MYFGIFGDTVAKLKFPEKRKTQISSKTVLLTGAAGFVGHHTLAHLLKTTDHNFVVTDSFKHRGISARLRSVFEEIPSAEKRVRVFTHDLNVPIDSVTASEFGNINFIINMASESHVDRSITDPREFFINNVNLVLTVLDYARNCSALEMMIQISTDEVYGPAAIGHYHKEWESQFPSNPYSASKASQENACFAYWRTYGIPLLITNTMNIIGERQDKEKFLPITISNLTKQQNVPVHAKLDSSGKWEVGSRYYLHARNQADALRFLLEKSPELDLRYKSGTKPLEKFNVVGERELRNDQLVELVAQFLGVSPQIEYLDFHSSRPGHDLRYALDSGKLKELGWKPPVPLEKSIERTVQWYQKNTNWLL